MRVGVAGLAVVAALSFGANAWAACLPEGPRATAFTTRAAPERAAGLLAMAGVLITMKPYEPKNLQRIKSTCEVARLQNGKRLVKVLGTADPGAPRIMPMSDRKAPLFFLMAVPDIQTVSATAPAKTLGYVLAARGDTDALVFRAYDVVPPDVQLASDLGAALEGRIAPMLRAELATHKVQISVGNGAGEVRERAASPGAQ